MVKRANAWVCLILPAVLLLAGCGSKDPLNRQAVSGSVTLDSEPVMNGNIEFSSTEPTGMMSGAMIVDGKYHIPAEKGLSPGEYLIRISSASAETQNVEEAGGDYGPPQKELIPAEFNVNSQEKRTVEAGQQNQFDFSISTSSKK